MPEKQANITANQNQGFAIARNYHKTPDIKLAVFDFEGTLIYSPGSKSKWEFVKKSTWELIGDALGAEAVRRKMHEAFLRGEFDYITWIAKSIDNFKEYGLTRQKLEDIIDEQTEIMPGTLELFNELDRRGIKKAVISGGIKNVYDIFAKKYDLKVDYVNMATELTFSKSGRLTGGIASNIDKNGKVTVLRGICSELGITMSECSYVGDAPNDLSILRKVGLPVAINAGSEEVRSAARFVIDDKDISGLIQYLRHDN